MSSCNDIRERFLGEAFFEGGREGVCVCGERQAKVSGSSEIEIQHTDRGPQ